MFCNSRGFSLVEMAVLLVIFGGLAAASTMLGSKWIEGTEVQTTRQNIETIEKAIDAYVRLNRRLPCPAPETVSSSSSDFGKEAEGLGSCMAGANMAESASTETRKGVVPFKTLGIGKSLAYDAWGNRLSYYVDKRMTEENALDVYPVNSTTPGDIVVQDLTMTNNRTTKAVFALVSHGARAHGARNRTGALLTADSPHDGELENADVNAAGASTVLDNTLVQAMVSGSFDDIVSYKLRSQLASSGVNGGPESCDANAAVAWTQGTANCVGGHGELADGESVQVVDGTLQDTGTVTVVCDRGTVNQVSPACAYVPLNCTAQAVNWTVGGNNCTATVGALIHSQYQDVTDSTSSTTGTARFTCNDGVISGSIEVCNVECSATTVNWTQGGNNCTGSVGVVAHGASALVSDALNLPTDQTSGNVTVMCNNGTFSQSGINCTYTNNDCVAGTRNWSVNNGNGARNCTGSIVALTHGTSSTVVDSILGTPSDGSGSASYSCSDGTLTEGAKTCRSQCAAGTANWTVGGANCSQTYSLMNDGASVAVSDATGPDTGDVTLTCADGVITQSAATCISAPSCSAGSADAVRFRGTQRLNKTFTVAPTGARRTYTVSMWLKRSGGYNGGFIWGGGFSGSSDWTGLTFWSDDRLRFMNYVANDPQTVFTVQEFRDYSKWYHIVLAHDTTNPIASERIRIYVDGVRQQMTGTMPQNFLSYFMHTGSASYIGRWGGSGANFDGYMDKFIAVDGQALEPTAFGEFDASGNWIPKAYTGTYGTNGFKLEFDNATTTATLGNDSSGNGNNFTTTGFSLANDHTLDSVADHPGTNYATVNPLDMGTSNTQLLQDGNLYWVAQSASGGAYGAGAAGTIAVSSGKWYWEVKPSSAIATPEVGIGVIDAAATRYVNDFWNSNYIAWYTMSGSYPTGAPSFTNGDVIGVALDMDAGKIWFSKNGSWILSGNPSAGTNPAYSTLTGRTVKPVFVDYNDNVNAAYARVNFGQQPFVYTAPSGFRTLSANNLPAPTITKPNEHFDAITYRGNGGGGQIGQIARDSSSYQLDRSLRLRSTNNANLVRTPASAGTSRKTGTYSVWVKRGRVSDSAYPSILGAQADSANTAVFRFTNTDQLEFGFVSASADAGNRTTAARFKDTSRWMHVVAAWDTTNLTASQRIRLYVDGVEQTSFAYSSDPALNFDTQFSNAVAHYIGRNSWSATGFFDGYMSDFHFVDGQALPASNFGEFDTKGHWQPKAYTGAYGTNGFRLDFADNSSVAQLGNDVSGNNNDFTSTGFSLASDYTNDSLTDVPTSWDDTGNGRGNYAVLGPSGVPNSGINPTTNGNLTQTFTWAESIAGSTMLMKTGKYYAEFTIGPVVASYPRIGLSSETLRSGNVGLHDGPYDVGYSQHGLVLRNSTTTASYASFTTGDVIGVAFDADTRKVWFSKNGSWNGNPVVGTGPADILPGGRKYQFAMSGYSANGSIHANFGQRPFKYAAPTGFKALNSQNAGTSTKFVGKPDMVWLKSRTAATDHAIYDAQRGIKKDLVSNSSAAETTQEGGVVQFNDDGVLIGDLAKINTANNGYAGWMWNEDAAAGFDIVQWAGTGGNRTINHSLGRTPKFMIVRNNSHTANWRIYHAGANATPQNGRLFFDTGAFTTESTAWNNTAPTSSQFTVGTDLNNNAYEYVAYLWAEIPGFSKFGSYTGNGSTDGAFVYTGFKPRFVMVKRSNSSCDWVMFDTERSPHNVAINSIPANLSSAGGDDTGASAKHVDLISSGFKLRGTDSCVNGSGDSYIYVAFAERPFTASGSSGTTSCGCTLPWGGFIASGGSVNAYSIGSLCTGSCPAPVSRTCTNGVLSGSGDYASCSTGVCAACPAGTATWTVYNNCTVASGTTWTVGANTCTVPSNVNITHGNNGSATDATVPTTGTATWNCNDGTATLQGGATCGAACTGTPWGTIAHNTSVTAWNTTASCGGCASQTRTCTNGTLSGSYTATSCNNASCASCWGPSGWVTHGNWTYAYAAWSVSCGSSCAGEWRYCNNGSLSGSYWAASCSATCASCALPWGGSIGHGASVTAYSSVDFVNGGCYNFYDYSYPQTRTCSNGTLSGSYPYQSGWAAYAAANCFTCFPSGTRVMMADGSTKAIEAVQIGDKVKGRNGTNRVIGLKPTRAGDRAIYTINGVLKTTADHPALTDKGWAVISRELYGERYYGRTVSVVVDDEGNTENRSLTSVPPSDIQEYGIGDKIAFGDEEFVMIESMTQEMVSAETPLYTLELDGDGTMQLEGGYVYTGLGIKPDKVK